LTLEDSFLAACIRKNERKMFVGYVDEPLFFPEFGALP